MAKKIKEPIKEDQDPRIAGLMRDYARGQNDMEQRKNRKNGWNDVIKAYLNVIPSPWPFVAKVAEPLIRTTILEKNGRLLNSKLRGRLVPRENGDLVKARVNNALIDFQWDRATTSGTMIEKTAMADLRTRLFGASFAWVYWNSKKDCNEMKIVDNRDVLIDPRLDHVRSAEGDNWIMIREWTTPEALREQGFDVPLLDETAQDNRSTSYEQVVKAIRGIDDWSSDKENPALEVIHKMTCEETTTFLPKHKEILKEKPNKRDKIQVAMLRYYPLPEDIYGESEVEPVMGLARSINWQLSGFMEEGNKMMHPPIITAENGVRRETIVHTPGAIWIANNPDLIKQMPMGNGIIAAFNNTYPMLKNAFQTAMGSQSIGVSGQQGGSFQDKTATEVRDQAQQQSTRDQYNQLYLGEFLKDIMMMWVENNKEFLLDDQTKSTYILRIVGEDSMKQFKQMGLDQMDVPPEAMNEITDMVSQNPNQYSDQQLQGMVDQVSQPKYPVVTNPEADPTQYNVVPKLDIKDNGEEADLHIERDDFDGVFDFIPDVVSMSAGANVEQKRERREALALLTTPEAQQNLMASGYRLKAKELYSTVLADSKYDDANNYFEQIPQGNPGMPGVNPSAGIGGLQAPTGMGPGANPMANAQPQGFPVNGQVRPALG